MAIVHVDNPFSSQEGGTPIMKSIKKSLRIIAATLGVISMLTLGTGVNSASAVTPGTQCGIGKSWTASTTQVLAVLQSKTIQDCQIRAAATCKLGTQVSSVKFGLWKPLGSTSEYKCTWITNSWTVNSAGHQVGN